MTETREFSRRDLEKRTWLYAAAATGEAGERWARAFQESEFPAALESARLALVELRQGRVDDGETRLRRCRELLATTEAEPSLALVYERFLCGVVAYRHFRVGDYDGALGALEKGEQAALAALEQHRFLMAMANIFWEFSVQRARIARDRRQWREIDRQLDRARQMLLGERPLCRLGDGEAIFVATVGRYFEQFQVSEEDRRRVAQYYDAEHRLDGFEKFVARLPFPRDFVVPYR